MVSTPMTDAQAIPDGWKAVASPPSLFKRFEFGRYADVREFLDRLSLLSEETRLYPDLGFARTYVNVTLHGGAADGSAFAARANSLAAAGLS